MTCADCADLLPLVAAGDRPPPDHLRDCPACQQALAELRLVCDRLDDAPVPELPPVDLAALDDWQFRRDRRQRWLTRGFGLTAAAAVVAGLLLLKLEIRVHGQQFTVRWGQLPEAPPPIVPPPPEPGVSPERVRVISELVQALADNVERLDRDRHDDQNFTERRLAVIERGLSELLIAARAPEEK